MRGRNEGFTLIEMLVVVAMIGLLSAVVLIALGPSRDKARDTRIVSDINQVRMYMETTYDAITGSYSGSTSDPEISTASEDIANAGGGNFTLSKAGFSYAVSAILNSGDIYCADSNGVISSNTAQGGECPVGLVIGS